MRSVVLIGAFGSGKSTIAEALRTEWGYQRYSFAEPLKAFLALAYGPIDKNATYQTLRRTEWDYVWLGSPLPVLQEETGRQLLQRFGTEVIRNQLDEDFWVKAARRTLTQPSLVNRLWAIDDMRFPNEYEMLRQLGFAVVRLTGRSIEVRDAEAAHVSESMHASFEVDFEVANDGPTPSAIARQIVVRMGGPIHATSTIG